MPDAASPPPENPTPHIGTLAEKSLHAAIKTYLMQSGDLVETRVDGFVIDLKRGDLLIEIQTRNFNAMKRKLNRLLPEHRVHLVHPIPATKWIVKQTVEGAQVSRRRSPKRGKVYDIFREMVYLSHLMSHPNLSLEVLIVESEEVRVNDGEGSWRRKGWSIADHRLLAVFEAYTFHTPADLCALLPADLPEAFTTQDIAKGLRIPRTLAQKMAYSLRTMDVIHLTGKQGRSHLYSLSRSQ